MAKTIEQIREELDAKIPRDAISTRDAGFGGKKLPYLEGWYVIDRLNKVFGQGNWTYKAFTLDKTFEGEVNGKYYVSYVARVSFMYRFAEGGEWSEIIDVGFGDGQDGKNPGKCHELAVKEAVTDALKRCAKSLGMSMGLALYDKSQENVEDEAPAAKPSVNVQAVQSTQGPAIDSKPAVGSSKAQQAPSANLDAQKAVIKSAVKVLDAQKKVSIAQFKKLLQANFSVEKVDELKPEQVAEVLAGLRKDYPELRV